MSSPTPWAEMRRRLEAAQQTGRLPMIQWPNETFIRPTAQPFLEVEGIGNIAEPVEMGRNGQWNEDGTLHVQVYVPRGTGSTLAREIAERVVRLFRGACEGPVVYRRTSIGAGEKETEGTGMWWRLPVYIDWEYQDRPTSDGA
ncbi:hypothetical protein HMPREF9946_02572 [Acetobacteraceae bacterium AT-5844]|nr:hypothetical protein HMPREF9946_02572 [Acetobacteraceae bacterium AT-5844]